MALPNGTMENAAVIIPPFIAVDPSLWFHMVESTFDLATPKPITDSKTKYNYIVANLPPATATTVRDFIMSPNKTDPYLELKNKIIERCGETKTQEIRRLLAGENLGDRKPSEFLRIMKRRAENHNIDDSLLFELFNQAMPVPVQTILASLSPINSDKAAEVADRILDITPMNVSEVSNQNLLSHPSTSIENSLSNAELFNEIKQLRKEVQMLRRSRSATRNNSYRYRSKSRGHRNLCWYHAKFHDKAKKCVQPCSFSGNMPQEG